MPSVIVAAPAAVFLDRLTIMAVPAGTVCCRFITREGLPPLSDALFVVEGTVPAAAMAPVAFAGLVPPVAMSPFSVSTVLAAVIDVVASVVFAVMPGTVTVAVPDALSVIVCVAPPLIL